MKRSLLATLLLSALASPSFSYGPDSSPPFIPAPSMPKQCAKLNVVSQGETLLPIPYRGHTWIEGQNKAEYSLVITNHCPYRILSVVSVDGMNVLNGQTASVKQGGYIVEPGNSATISGWRKSMNDTAAFYFTYPGDSYGAKVGKDHNLGVIGAAFFGDKVQRLEAERRMSEIDGYGRRDDMPRFQDEQGPAMGGSMSEKEYDSKRERNAGPSARMMAPAASPSLGTGHGRYIEDRAVRSTFEREDSPFDVVNYRYETRAKLISMGALIASPPPMQPQAFPGENFTPDPPAYRRPWNYR